MIINIEKTELLGILRDRFVDDVIHEIGGRLKNISLELNEDMAIITAVIESEED